MPGPVFAEFRPVWIVNAFPAGTLNALSSSLGVFQSAHVSDLFTQIHPSDDLVIVATSPGVGCSYVGNIWQPPRVRMMIAVVALRVDEVGVVMKP